MRLIKNYLTQKLRGFKRGKTRRINFLCASRGFESSKFVFVFFIVNRENIKSQVKKVLSYIDLKSHG